MLTDEPIRSTPDVKHPPIQLREHGGHPPPSEEPGQRSSQSEKIHGERLYLLHTWMESFSVSRGLAASGQSALGVAGARPDTLCVRSVALPARGWVTVGEVTPAAVVLLADRIVSKAAPLR